VEVPGSTTPVNARALAQPQRRPAFLESTANYVPSITTRCQPKPPPWSSSGTPCFEHQRVGEMKKASRGSRNHITTSALWHRSQTFGTDLSGTKTLSRSGGVVQGSSIRLLLGTLLRYTRHLYFAGFPAPYKHHRRTHLHLRYSLIFYFSSVTRDEDERKANRNDGRRLC
jgi:hypothetical protein